MRQCPRCRAAAVEGQEYCLECSLRLPGRGRVGSAPGREWSLRTRLVGALALAVAGAAVAIGATWERGATEQIIVATGGSRTAPAPAAVAQGFRAWPQGRDGWTVVVVSVPKKTGGRAEALARARQARSRGLPQVGIVDSGAIASLHPGYWVVFAGVYDTEPEATSALQRARTVARTAATRRMAG